MLRQRDLTPQYHYEQTIDGHRFQIKMVKMTLPEAEAFEEHFRIELPTLDCPVHPLEVLNALGVDVLGRRCTHMYDCCGNYYASPAVVLPQQGDVLRVVQTSHQNI